MRPISRVSQPGHRTVIVTLCLGGLLYAAASAALDLGGTVWDQVAGRYQLDPYLLYSVALAESATPRGTGKTSPWPWVIRSPGGSIYVNSRHEAELRLKREILRWDAARIDVGLMQISSGWHRDRVREISELLDPETNLRIAAEILSEALRSAPDDLALGIGRYHSWDPRRAREYGQRVLAIYRNLTDRGTSFPEHYLTPPPRTNP